jgi:hypothetical protein
MQDRFPYVQFIDKFFEARDELRASVLKTASDVFSMDMKNGTPITYSAPHLAKGVRHWMLWSGFAFGISRHLLIDQRDGTCLIPSRKTIHDAAKRSMFVVNPSSAARLVRFWFHFGADAAWPRYLVSPSEQMQFKPDKNGIDAEATKRLIKEPLASSAADGLFVSHDGVKDGALRRFLFHIGQDGTVSVRDSRELIDSEACALLWEPMHEPIKELLFFGPAPGTRS